MKNNRHAILCFGLLICTLMVLQSCTTTRLAQASLLSFPWQDYQPPIVPADSVPPGLTSQESGNTAFPDLFLFIDRTMAPNLFAELWKHLPTLFSSNSGTDLSGLEKLPSDWANQILLFRAGQAVTFQALLIGNFPRSLLRSSLESQKDWRFRILDKNGTAPIEIFDNFRQGLHLGLLGDTGIVLQSDSADPTLTENSLQAFAIHARRSQELLHVSSKNSQTARPALHQVIKTQNNGITSATAGNLREVLALEGKRDDLFGFLAVALPATVPAAALRLRLEPVTTGTTTVLDVQVSLLPRPGSSVKSIKTGLKLSLVGLSGIAGLDTNFINNIIFTEKAGVLVMTGIQLSEKGAADLLGELLAQATKPKSAAIEKESGQ